jgi:hypothetical protein
MKIRIRKKRRKAAKTLVEKVEWPADDLAGPGPESCVAHREMKLIGLESREAGVHLLVLALLLVRRGALPNL